MPVVRADSPDTWIHGPMSDPAGMKIARNIRPLIAATECLNTELRAWNQPVADASAGIAAAYEKSLMYGEHTWGGSIGWLDSKFGFGDAFWQERASGRYQRIEESWDEHTAYIEQARDMTGPLLTSNLQALAQAVSRRRPARRRLQSAAVAPRRRRSLRNKRIHRPRCATAGLPDVPGRRAADGRGQACRRPRDGHDGKRCVHCGVGSAARRHPLADRQTFRPGIGGHEQ